MLMTLISIHCNTPKSNSTDYSGIPIIATVRTDATHDKKQKGVFRMTYTEAKTTEEMIMESLSILKGEGDVTELRILKHPNKGTVSGYFDDNQQLANAASEYDGNVPAIYFTLNPVKTELLSRAANRIVSRAKHTTSDADIECRRWFPIDFDPVRPTGIS
jgi:hypothetical protein